MKSITVRGIDKETEMALRKTSIQLGKSVNATIVSLIKKGLGLSDKGKPERFEDLDRLGGTWTVEDARSFERATEPFAQIDGELWQ